MNPVLYRFQKTSSATQGSAGLARVARRMLTLFAVGLAPLFAAEEPIQPRSVMVLFDGQTEKTLRHFYTWQAKFGHEDPDRVFSVVDQVDGAPAIRASGQHNGGIVTRRSFSNYKLVLEYRWGLSTWGKRAFKARDSGILLHSQGEDGNSARDFKGSWPRSVECQIIEGGTGDILLIPGYDRGNPELIRPTLTIPVLPGKKVWDPAGVPTHFNGGRIDWQFRDHAWKDVLGMRGPRDVEKPVGEWNRLEAVCRGGDVDYYLNGTKVNEGRNGSFTHGKVLFQSEGAEIFFRHIALHPLN